MDGIERVSLMNAFGHCSKDWTQLAPENAENHRFSERFRYLPRRWEPVLDVLHERRHLKEENRRRKGVSASIVCVVYSRNKEAIYRRIQAAARERDAVGGTWRHARKCTVVAGAGLPVRRSGEGDERDGNRQEHLLERLAF
jgi:hypothetical protein